MTLRKKWCALLLALLLGGCAGIPFEAPQRTPTQALSTEDLLETFWLGDGRVYRMRQSGLFQLRGMKLPIEGFMELDAAKRKARLVALEGLGVKLFDLSISADAVAVNQLLPDLRKHPGLPEAIAACVRRIFFQPQPVLTDQLEIAPREYRLRRTEVDGLSFIFTGEPPLLVEKRRQSATEDWSVGYYQYKKQMDRSIPEGIFLQDRRAGYTLTLWLESVKCHEE